MAGQILPGIKEYYGQSNLLIKPQQTKPYTYLKNTSSNQLLFTKPSYDLGVDYQHKEDPYSDYLRQKLIPYQVSDRGPAVSVGDLNNDGKEDIFFGGSKYIPSQIFIQSDSTFNKTIYPTINNDSIKEDISSVIADFNNDGKNDLFIATGGADFFNQMAPLTNSYYQANDNSFTTTVIPESFENASAIHTMDFDKDGDLDLFIANQSISADYGNAPNSYLLENKNGEFSKMANTLFDKLGLVTDALVTDFNNDGWEDLLVIGEWMAPRFFVNNEGNFKEVFPINDNKLNGLWESVINFDIDNDGDMDYLLGNWGLNTKFIASKEHPLHMYYGDLDDNGATETVVSIYKNGEYYPLDGLKEISDQLISLKKTYTNYKSFAGETTKKILGKKMLDKATLLSVHTLQSGYLRNDDGNFTFVPFNFELQLAPIMAFLKYDFDGNRRRRGIGSWGIILE